MKPVKLRHSTKQSHMQGERKICTKLMIYLCEIYAGNKDKLDTDKISLKNDTKCT